VAVGFGEGERGGCSSAEWSELPAGSIALVPPGPCFRRDVVLNASDAGAAALVASFPQWPAGEVRRPTLLVPDEIDIPAISASAELGEALREAADAGATVHVSVQTEIVPGIVRNVIAESHGVADRVVMLGGHLDSVHDGPGINDNGSGTAALLELARVFADEHPDARVRFAFWGGEEYALLGSRAYVQALGTNQRGEIAAYLNLDMLGSTNFVPFVYDSTDGALGSAEISDFLVAYLESRGIGAERTDLRGASDHASFSDAGIPTGGIFSGATERKFPAQAEAFGGNADEPMDACYHLACDTVANVTLEIVASFAEAAAAVSLAIATGALPIP
jgi:Zn-dependent M28 family amino/carboxypeptidase